MTGRLSLARELARHAWSRYLRPVVQEAVERPGVRELLPGLHHWTRVHPRIRQPVSSYYVEPAGLLIDPMVPREGLEWFEGRAPRTIVLTIRHHLRESERFVEAFGCEVRCHEAGLHEFADGPDVGPFSFGDELAPGVTALEVDAISPEETALHIELERGVLACGDGVTRPGGRELTFVPDSLIGDDPEAVKGDLAGAYARMLDLDFDTLLFAHGEPLVGGAKRALRDFVDSSLA